MSELYKVTTDFGEIIFGNGTIKKIVKDAVSMFNGKVFLSNPKGKIQAAASKKSSAEGGSGGSGYVEVSFEASDIHIRIYVIIRFGTSISRVTNRLIEKVYEDVSRVMGVAPASISVVVAGTMSKNTKRRNIEVVKHYADY